MSVLRREDNGIDNIGGRLRERMSWLQRGLLHSIKIQRKLKKTTETKNERREVAKREAAPSHDQRLFAWPADAGIEELEPSFELLSPSYSYFESVPFASFWL